VATELQPALTTVRVPLEELGRAAVRAGLGGQEPNADPFAHQQPMTTLGTVVVVRDSVGPPR
jgi:LacI family transcriptional regulator